MYCCCVNVIGCYVVECFCDFGVDDFVVGDE